MESIWCNLGLRAFDMMNTKCLLMLGVKVMYRKNFETFSTFTRISLLAQAFLFSLFVNHYSDPIANWVIYLSHLTVPQKVNKIKTSMNYFHVGGDIIAFLL